ncbi:hypothetical protein MGN70_002123 [Eutypa lata]|nr:hypothetical protein MGN70_002123 [Eutypa lata]
MQITASLLATLISVVAALPTTTQSRENQRIGIVHTYGQRQEFTELNPGGLMVIKKEDRDKLTFAGIDRQRSNFDLNGAQSVECRIEDLEEETTFGTFGLGGRTGVLLQDVTRDAVPATIQCDLKPQPGN